MRFSRPNHLAYSACEERRCVVEVSNGKDHLVKTEATRYRLVALLGRSCTEKVSRKVCENKKLKKKLLSQIYSAGASMV